MQDPLPFAESPCQRETGAVSCTGPHSPAQRPTPLGPSRSCSRSFLLAEPLRQFILSHRRVTWSTRTSCQPQSIRSQAPHSESKGYSCRALPSEPHTLLANAVLPCPPTSESVDRPSLHQARAALVSPRHPSPKSTLPLSFCLAQALQRACVLPCLICARRS